MFSKLALSVVTALATSLVSIPALAELDHAAINKHLNKIGVTTEVGTCSPISAYPENKPFGTYDSNTNHLCLSDQIQTLALLDETVLHELVHVIQDCIGGGIQSNDLSSVTRFISNGDRNLEDQMDQQLLSKLTQSGYIVKINDWTEHLTDNQKWIEHEAYGFEDKPEFVLSLLSMCDLPKAI